MPLVDKPLAELYRYEGRNPRPADFDAYWHDALAELAATDPKPVLERAVESPSRCAECFHLWFTGVGGARIYAKYLRPRGTGRYPAVLRFHGYSMNSGMWAEKLGWPAEGFCYAAMDCRGQGGRSEDLGGVKGTTWRGHLIRGLDDPDSRKLAYRSIFLDTVQLARVVMSFAEVDPGRVGAFGGSQGGGLALACAALEPRIRRVAPVNPFLSDYLRYWEMDLAKDVMEELRYYFRVFDPTHANHELVFTKLGYLDLQHLAPRIQAEVLMQTGLMDTTCPPSTQFATFNKLAGPKRVIVYPDFGHEVLPGDLDHMLEFMQQL